VCKVVVYSGGWCQGCKVVKKVLEQNYIEFTEVDIDTEEGMLKAKELGIRNIPVTFVGEERFIGSSPEVVKLIIKEVKGE
jgi:glutaredoxin